MSFRAYYFKIVLSKNVIFGDRYFDVLGVICSVYSFYVRYSVSKIAVGPIAKRDSSVLTMEEFITSTLGYLSTT
jgi:hypothetical protein